MKSISEDEGNTFLRNVRKHLSAYTEPHPKIHYSSLSPPCKHNGSSCCFTQRKGIASLLHAFKEPYLMTPFLKESFLEQDTIFNLLTNSMEGVLLKRLINGQASLQVPSILWNPKVHNLVQKIRPLAPNPCQMNPVHSSSSYLFIIYFNINLSYIPNS
jgi:hypothetical protein